MLWNGSPEPLVPIDPQREIKIALPIRQQMDPLGRDSSNWLELRSDRHRPRESTHDPLPSSAGTARVQTLAGTADDMDDVSENVDAHRLDAM